MATTPQQTARPKRSEFSYEALDPLGRGVARMAASPRWAVYVATGLAVALAWVWLVGSAAGIATYSDGASLGSGMGALLPWLTDLGQWVGTLPGGDVLLRLCTPSQAGGLTAQTAIVVFAMWAAMSVAMMLPSAAPLIATYCDIADVAAEKGERVMSVAVLVAGYLTIWLVFSFLATLVLLAIVWSPLGNGLSAPVGGALAGCILVVAGLYQFSSLRHACLEKCRNPFSTLFGSWSTERAGVFRIGLQQGLWCLGCCWALMSLMLVVGTMNLAWMALLALFAIGEKSIAGKSTSRLSGGILLVWGVALMLLAALQA